MKRFKPGFKHAARATKQLRSRAMAAPTNPDTGLARFFMENSPAAAAPGLAPHEKQLQDFVGEVSMIMTGSLATCECRREMLEEDSGQHARTVWILRLSVPSQSSRGACLHTVFAQVKSVYKHSESPM